MKKDKKGLNLENKKKYHHFKNIHISKCIESIYGENIEAKFKQR